MDESSERLVWLEHHDDEITRVVNDVAIRSNTRQDRPLAVAEMYDRVMVLIEMEELLFVNRTHNQTRDTFLPYYSTTRVRYIGLPEEESQRPWTPLRKARMRRDPPPRVSRRFSQVSSPVYLRHRFLPQSRKDYSSQRQR
ncbi:hypothetical protein N665_0078s0068 [Sinapis alba]|nr:hypothetical protein N665_0078s0068 [Sinapis alba]